MSSSDIQEKAKNSVRKFNLRHKRPIKSLDICLVGPKRVKNSLHRVSNLPPERLGVYFKEKRHLRSLEGSLPLESLSYALYVLVIKTFL